jgi:hypothetical protein
MNMRACGSSPVTSPRLFSAYRGANDDAVVYADGSHARHVGPFRELLRESHGVWSAPRPAPGRGASAFLGRARARTARRRSTLGSLFWM